MSGDYKQPVNMCTLMVLLLPEDNPKDSIFPGAGCSGYPNSGILKLMDNKQANKHINNLPT